jgi:hypothetical protein
MATSEGWIVKGVEPSGAVLPKRKRSVEPAGSRTISSSPKET